MEIAKNVALVLHFIGLAGLIGGFMVQMKDETKRIDASMFHGALTQLVTGLALVGIAEAGDATVNHTKIGIKLVILLVIGFLVVRHRRRESVSPGVWGAIGGLTVVNTVIAVFW